jgi:putative transposase
MRHEVGLSERRVGGLIGLRRLTYRYAPWAAGALELRTRLRALAERWVRYGYRRLYDRLRREGWRVNHKRVYRLYQLEGLGLRRKRPKRAAGLRVIPLVPPRRTSAGRWTS